jgi:hypothetical protein
MSMFDDETTDPMNFDDPMGILRRDRDAEIDARHRAGGFRCQNCSKVLLEVQGGICPACLELLKRTSPNAPQPPVVHDYMLPVTWELVIADMRERDQIGRQKYGTPLQPRNGRDSLIDAYQECLDLCVYLRNEIETRKLSGPQAAQGVSE